MKQRTVNYFSSNKLRTGETQRGEEAFAKVRSRLLGDFNMLLSAIGSDEEFPGTHIDDSEVQESDEWDGVCTRTGPRLILERKDS